MVQPSTFTPLSPSPDFGSSQSALKQSTIPDAVPLYGSILAIAGTSSSASFNSSSSYFSSSFQTSSSSNAELFSCCMPYSPWCYDGMSSSDCILFGGLPFMDNGLCYGFGYLCEPSSSSSLSSSSSSSITSETAATSSSSSDISTSTSSSSSESSSASSEALRSCCVGNSCFDGLSALSCASYGGISLSGDGYCASGYVCSISTTSSSAFSSSSVTSSSSSISSSSLHNSSSSDSNSSEEGYVSCCVANMCYDGVSVSFCYIIGNPLSGGGACPANGFCPTVSSSSESSSYSSEDSSSNSSSGCAESDKRSCCYEESFLYTCNDGVCPDDCRSHGTEPYSADGICALNGFAQTKNWWQIILATLAFNTNPPYCPLDVPPGNSSSSEAAQNSSAESAVSSDSSSGIKPCGTLTWYEMTPASPNRVCPAAGCPSGEVCTATNTFLPQEAQGWCACVPDGSASSSDPFSHSSSESSDTSDPFSHSSEESSNTSSSSSSEDLVSCCITESPWCVDGETSFNCLMNGGVPFFDNNVCGTSPNFVDGIGWICEPENSSSEASSPSSTNSSQGSAPSSEFTSSSPSSADSSNSSSSSSASSESSEASEESSAESAQSSLEALGYCCVTPPWCTMNMTQSACSFFGGLSWSQDLMYCSNHCATSSSSQSSNEVSSEDSSSSESQGYCCYWFGRWQWQEISQSLCTRMNQPAYPSNHYANFSPVQLAVLETFCLNQNSSAFSSAESSSSSEEKHYCCVMPTRICNLSEMGENNCRNYGSLQTPPTAESGIWMTGVNSVFDCQTACLSVTQSSSAGSDGSNSSEEDVQCCWFSTSYNAWRHLQSTPLSSCLCDDCMTADVSDTSFEQICLQQNSSSSADSQESSAASSSGPCFFCHPDTNLPWACNPNQVVNDICEGTDGRNISCQPTIPICPPFSSSAGSEESESSEGSKESSAESSEQSSSAGTCFVCDPLHIGDVPPDTPDGVFVCTPSRIQPNNTCLSPGNRVADCYETQIDAAAICSAASSSSAGSEESESSGASSSAGSEESGSSEGSEENQSSSAPAGGCCTSPGICEEKSQYDCEALSILFGEDFPWAPTVEECSDVCAASSSNSAVASSESSEDSSEQSESQGSSEGAVSSSQGSSDNSASSSGTASGCCCVYSQNDQPPYIDTSLNTIMFCINGATYSGEFYPTSCPGNNGASCASCNMCSHCGGGWGNLCDSTECSNLGPCSFVSGWFSNSCEPNTTCTNPSSGSSSSVSLGSSQGSSTGNSERSENSAASSDTSVSGGSSNMSSDGSEGSSATSSQSSDTSSASSAQTGRCCVKGVGFAWCASGSSQLLCSLVHGDFYPFPGSQCRDAGPIANCLPLPPSSGSSSSSSNGECGNGIIRTDVSPDSPLYEECDDGPGNSDAANAFCRTDCTFARCGDGIIDTAPPDVRTSEVCDDGPLNSDSNNATGTCRLNCRKRVFFVFCDNWVENAEIYAIDDTIITDSPVIPPGAVIFFEGILTFILR